MQPENDKPTGTTSGAQSKRRVPAAYRFILLIAGSSEARTSDIASALQRLASDIRRTTESVQITGYDLRIVGRDKNNFLACLRKAAFFFSDTGKNRSADLQGGAHVLQVNGDDSGYADLFEQAVRYACEQAAAGEVLLTETLLNILPAESHDSCLLKVDHKNPDRKLYAYQPVKPGEMIAEPVFVLPAQAVDEKQMCFYCGVSAHTAGHCPSKLLQTADTRFDDLAAKPFSEIKKMYTDFFSAIVAPLGTPEADKRYERIIDKNRDDGFVLAFHAFYDVFLPFQQRFVREMFKAEKVQEMRHDKGGTLMLGMDCLRVSRYAEARDILLQVLEKNPNNYRPHVALGLLEIDTGRPEKALSSLKKSYEAAGQNRERFYIQLLITRLYEIAGDIYSAHEEAARLIREQPDWHAAKYYHAVLLARCDEPQKALDIMKDLFEHNPTTYLKLFCDPGLRSCIDEAASSFSAALLHLKYISDRSYESIKKKMQHYDSILDRQDSDFASACELFKRASELQSDMCLAGLTDMPALETRIMSLVDRAVINRRRALLKAFDALKKMYVELEYFIQHYPYPAVVTNQDRSVFDRYAKALQESRSLISRAKSQQFQDAEKRLGDLEKQYDRLKVVRGRLSVLQNILFIGECTVRMISAFAASGAVCMIVTGIVVVLSRQITGSAGQSQTGDVVRFSLWSGLAGGLLFSAGWTKSRFRGWYRKLVH